MFCVPHSIQTQINITKTELQEMIVQRQKKVEEIKLSLEEINVSYQVYLYTVECKSVHERFLENIFQRTTICFL